MRHLYYFFIFTIIGLLGCNKKTTQSQTTATTAKVFLSGADMSYLPEVRSSGVAVSNANNQAEDMLTTLKNAGGNLVRLRLWHNPSDATSNLNTVLQLSNEIKSKGLQTLITIHYSDSWADPGKQTKPVAWQSLTTPQLIDSVYQYTKNAMQLLLPDYVQIGNEINGGLLWPNGNISNAATMKSILNSGIRAVREASTKTKIMLHYAGINGAESFFSNLAGTDYDVIGISYYPFWHGKDLILLQQTLSNLSQNQNKYIMLAEVSYPFTLSWNDYTNNIIGLTNQILPEYPATPEGQKNYLKKIRTMMYDLPKGLGFCYWGAEWISYRGNTATNGSSWENQALWDFSGKALPVLEAYR